MASASTASAIRNVVIPKRGRGDVRVTLRRRQRRATIPFECSHVCGAGHGFMRGVDPREAADRVRGDREARDHVVSVVAVAARALLVVAAQSAPAQVQRRRGSAIRSRASSRRSSSASASGSTISSRSRRPKKGSARRSTRASCAVCHNVPAIGGASLVSEVRAAYRDEHGEIHKLTAPDGSELDTLFHLFSIPPHGCQPVMPPEANIIARRVPIPSSAPDWSKRSPTRRSWRSRIPTIATPTASAAAPRASSTSAPAHVRIGRFGWKAQHATLRTFSADAYRNEMGITNELFPDEAGGRRVGGSTMKLCDPIPDPEDVADLRTRLAAIDNFEAFMKFLAPPPRGTIDAVGAGRRADLQRDRLRGVPRAGRCRPRRIAPSAVHRASAVPLFSDLLLHDVGTGDHIPQASALPNEIRTPSLWGLRVRRPLLHDGSASTAEEAIARHGGEAEGVRRRFEQLSAAQRSALIAFLNSL